MKLNSLIETRGSCQNNYGFLLEFYISQMLKNVNLTIQEHGISQRNSYIFRSKLIFLVGKAV